MNGSRILEFIPPHVEAKLIKSFVTQHDATEFILERVWCGGTDSDERVDVLHLISNDHNRPLCDKLGERNGSMTIRPTRGARTRAIMCRRCRDLNRR